MEWLLIYLSMGAVVGFFAGLLGIGGGLIIVPALTFIFTAQDFPPDRILHLALGTTMATIIFTSAASLRAHHSYGAINWVIVKHITPGIILGTFIGTTIASTLTNQVLSIIFVVFIFFAATQMLLKLNPVPSFQLPGKIGLFAAGNLIGAISSLVAIGGGLLSVPFLSICNVKLHQAIGTASAIGFPIAITGTAGYITNGLMLAQSLPDYCLGYVYLPALAWLVLASMITAPYGARTAHSIQTATLKKIFVALLYCLGVKMLLGII